MKETTKTPWDIEGKWSVSPYGWSEEVGHNDQARKGSDGDRQGRQKRQQGEQDEDLHRNGQPALRLAATDAQLDAGEALVDGRRRQRRL